MSAPLDELYFQWLYSQVADPNIQEKRLTYWRVLKILFEKEFVWVDEVVNDENRIKDGKALRVEFIEKQGWAPTDVDSDWVEIGCSMLELMVGLSRRLAWLADGQPHYWFRVLLDNIGLGGYNDQRRIPRRQIDDALNDIIYRNYEPTGLGGFFPLQYPKEDQRDIEIWTQMNEYVQEYLDRAG